MGLGDGAGHLGANDLLCQKPVALGTGELGQDRPGEITGRNRAGQVLTCVSLAEMWATLGEAAKGWSLLDTALVSHSLPDRMRCDLLSAPPPRANLTTAHHCEQARHLGAAGTLFPRWQWP